MSLQKKDTNTIMSMISKVLETAFENYHCHCRTCGSGLVTLKEFSPDGPPYYFCNYKCYKTWKRLSNEIYRSLPPTRTGIKK